MNKSSGVCLFIVVQKMVTDAVLFIRDHRAEVDIGNAFEDVCLDLGICLLQGSDQLLCLKTLGGRGAILMTCGAGVGEVAGTLQEMQAVPIPPPADVCLPNKVHRADQLHAFEMSAVQFRHHGLNLSAVQQSHQNRLNDVVIVVAECDFVAAKFLCLTVEIPSAHSRAEITGVFLHRVNYVKNRAFL